MASAEQFGKWCLFCVNHQELFDATAKNTIKVDFAVLDADDRAGAGIDGITFGSGTITKDDNDFLFVLAANKRFQALDPILEGLEVGFLG